MASLIGYVFDIMGFSETNIVIVYILFVLLSARFTQGYIYGIIASIASTVAYNYLFTEPYFTLRVNDLNYIITFVIMTITATITSTLTSRIKKNASESARKETEMRALYQLTTHLTAAQTMDDMAIVSVKAISKLIAYKIGCLCFDEDGIPEKRFIQQLSEDKQVYRLVEDGVQIKHNMEQLKTAFYEGKEFCDWPIYGREVILGIIRIPVDESKNLKDSQIKLLRTMIESTALAMDRFKEANERLRSTEAMVNERYRANLLRAVSHDLRTPLSGIMGTAEILMDMTEKSQETFALVSAIHKEADWLRSLVENILNLTKLQEGKLILNKTCEALEELIGSAINHFSRRAPEFDIVVEMPEEVILVMVDAKLIMQVLINLLDNAMKHSKDSTEIVICVKYLEAKRAVEIAVIDYGEGIPVEDLPNIFQMFYTSYSRITDIKQGIGLGLSIAQSIICAHGGTVKAENRKEGDGAIFSFTLPIKENEYE